MTDEDSTRDEDLRAIERLHERDMAAAKAGDRTIWNENPAEAGAQAAETDANPA